MFAREHASMQGMLTCEHVSRQKTLAREHVSTQGTLECEHVSTQGTLAREHVKTQGTLAREHISTQGTLIRGYVSTLNTLARKYVSTQGTLICGHVFSTQGTQFSRLNLNNMDSFNANFKKQHESVNNKISNQAKNSIQDLVIEELTDSRKLYTNNTILILTA